MVFYCMFQQQFVWCKKVCVFNFRAGISMAMLTLLFLELVFTHEHRHHQLTHRRLDWDIELAGLGAARGTTKTHTLYKAQRTSLQGFKFHTGSATYHSWKLAACVESQKSIPMTTVTVSPGARTSAGKQQQCCYSSNTQSNGLMSFSEVKLTCTCMLQPNKYGTLPLDLLKSNTNTSEELSRHKYSSQHNQEAS